MGLRLDFDGKGSGVYVLQGSVQTDERHPGLMASVSTEGKDAFFPEVLELRSGSAATTYGAPGSHSLCPAPAVCTLSADGSSTGSLARGAEVPVLHAFAVFTQAPERAHRSRAKRVPAIVRDVERHERIGALPTRKPPASGNPDFEPAM